MVNDVPVDEKEEKQNQNTTSPYLDIDDAAARLRLSPHTLNKWRHEGRGPAFRDHGRRIVYHIDDLDSWSHNQKRQKARIYKGKKSDASNQEEEAK